MKLALITALLFLSFSLKGQESNNKNWLPFENEKCITKTMTKSETYKIQELTFKIQWDKKMSYSENLKSHYGGISTLEIYYKNIKLQTINKIEVGVALGEIYINFYDFNMDGYLDFSIQRECEKNYYDNFYLYNNSKRRFIHQTDWDFIRIKKTNKKTKQLLTQTEENTKVAEGKIYDVINTKLIEFKAVNYKD